MRYDLFVLYFKCQKFSRPEYFVIQAIREFSRVLMEFNFANQQGRFISGGLILVKLDFLRQKRK